jgi:hypothetical protein
MLVPRADIVETRAADERGKTAPESFTALRSLEASLSGIMGALHVARALPPTSARARANFKKRGDEVSVQCTRAQRTRSAQRGSE